LFLNFYTHIYKQNNVIYQDQGKIKEIYYKGGLLLLHRIVHKRQNSLPVKQTVSRILANMSVDPALSKAIVKTGKLKYTNVEVPHHFRM